MQLSQQEEDPGNWRESRYRGSQSESKERVKSSLWEGVGQTAQDKGSSLTGAVRRGNSMGAAVWEPIACCSWQPGGTMPGLRVSDWEVEVIFFISHFHIPQTLQLLRGGLLPCKIINPRLFSHVVIQQALEGCSWVSFSSWVGSHGCFFHPQPPAPRKHSQRDTPYLTDTWKSLGSVARSHVKNSSQDFPRIYPYRHAQRI